MYKDSLISFIQKSATHFISVSCADPSTEANSKRKQPKMRGLVSKGVNELLFKKNLSISIRSKELLYPKKFRQIKMVFEGHFRNSVPGLNMYCK